MIASDWVVVASVVVGDQGALVGGGGLPVPPERRGQSEQALRDPDNHAGQGAAAVAFQPKLVFEGVEGALDPLPPAAQRAMPAWFVGAVRSQQHRAIAGNELLELAAGEPLVGQDDQPRPQPVALVVQQRGDHLALAQLGLARHQAIGSPSGPARKYSRNPQEERRWLWQQPPPATPASADRLTVSRDAAHGTGVESTRRSWSPKLGVGTARSLIASATSGPARRSRRL